MRGASGKAPPCAGRFLGLGMLLAGTGCASSDGALQVELSRLRRELHQAQDQARAAEARIERLETQVGVLRARVEATERRPRPAARASRSTEPLPLRELEPDRERRLPVVRLGPGPSVEPVGPDEPPVLIRIRGERTERLTVDREVLHRPDPVLDRDQATRDPEQAYADALTTLREDKDPGRALAQFRAFLEAHPDHRLADNALYWSGESQQMLVQHGAAIETFERLLARYPRSSKAPWAKLRVAESHLVLGREARGRALLEALEADHPSSEPAKLARARLEALAAVDR